jgi:SAM-dependent methyltransferase
VTESFERARTDQPGFYDARYEQGYMQDFLDPYEACRVVTIDDTLRTVSGHPRRILDFGCGEGRYLSVLQRHFPEAQLVGCDVSKVALGHAQRNWPRAEFTLMTDGLVPAPDGSFDLILSVEVLEHVADVELATRELGRLLAPSGRLVVTTPCANPCSVEWIVNWRRGGLQPTPDGYGRFATDEPGHLRRLTSRDLRVLLQRAGLIVERVDFRAQLFAALMVRTPRRIARLVGDAAMVRFGLLDWRLLRRLPNGATMVMVARKPSAG